LIAFTLPQNRAGKKFRIHLPRGPDIFSFHLPPVKYYLPSGYATCLINYRSSCPKYCLQSAIDCDKMSFLVLSQVKDTNWTVTQMLCQIQSNYWSFQYLLGLCHCPEVGVKVEARRLDLILCLRGFEF